MTAPVPVGTRRRAARARRRPRARLLLACGLAVAVPKGARADVTVSAASACAPHAAEAAARSALPETVVLRVMHVESRGRAKAVSPKGAIGCMQIMPATWRYLTARHGLGGDPWNARFNMIGGALYLAELARQFGFPGAYAAYNAGPGRYARHVHGAAPLPAETVAYMASLSGTAPPRRADTLRAPAPAPRWQEAGLFLRAEHPRAEVNAVSGAATRDIAPSSVMAKTVRVSARAADTGERATPGGLFPLARSGGNGPEGNARAE